MRQAELDSLPLLGPSVEISGDTLRLLCGPGVYVLSAGDVTLYVGASGSLLGRVASPRHEKRQAHLQADRLLLLPCASRRDAQALEEVLIEVLQPIYNEGSRIVLTTEERQRMRQRLRWTKPNEISLVKPETSDNWQTVKFEDSQVPEKADGQSGDD